MMNLTELRTLLDRVHTVDPAYDSDIVRSGGFGEVISVSMTPHGVLFDCDPMVNVRNDAKWEYFEYIFLKAGIPVLNHHELVNQYLPRSYVQDFMETPWWLAVTPFGNIKIGWRKRVMEIDWTDTPVRAIITEDATTKGTTHVHAWSREKAVEYVSNLAVKLRAHSSTG